MPKSRATGRKRKKSDDFFDEEDEEAVFLGSDEEGNENETNLESEEEDADVDETAEEKRLRLGTMSDVACFSWYFVAFAYGNM